MTAVIRTTAEYLPPEAGQLLLGSDFVAGGAVHTDLARQMLENRKLGELIMELGMLDEIDLHAVMSIQNELKEGGGEDLAAAVGSRLGAILIASNCLSKSQLDYAVAQLDDSEEQLGDILIRQGVLTPSQLSGALNFQKRLHAHRSDRYRLGQMMVASGHISEDTLAEAVERQKVTGGRLGETLLESGAITNSALRNALAQQRRFISAATAALSFLMAAGMPNQAAGATTKLQVSARILTHVAVRSMKIPTQVSITPADVAQGYVDIESPIEMEVVTNSAGGVLVGISLNASAFTGAIASGQFGTMRLTPGTPELVVGNRGQGMRTESLSMRLRIELARNAEPGVIAMPVSLFLSPA